MPKPDRPIPTPTPEKWTPEPWTDRLAAKVPLKDLKERLRPNDETIPVRLLSEGNFQRAKLCVNACAPLGADPAGALAAARKAGAKLKAAVLDNPEDTVSIFVAMAIGDAVCALERLGGVAT